MELYTLDSLLRRENIVSGYESLIWTERYATTGDLEMVVPSNASNRNLLKAGTWLALSESLRCMRVETLEDTVDEEGQAVLKIYGRSIESVLENRVAFNAKTGLEAHPKWVISGLQPMVAASKIFDDICRNGLTDPDDIIPFLVSGVELFPVDTIQGPTEAVTFELDPQSVFDTIKNIAELYDFGFRLCRNYDHSQLVFDLYTGCDRTSGQTFLNPVIFSPDLENLQNTTELASVAGFKNIAWVYSPVGFQEVVAEGVDPSVTGFERQILMVRADDITSTDPAVATAQMIQRGREELSKHRTFGAFDGEITRNSQYKYGRDYNLGDLIEMRSSGGVLSYMRVTEQIFVSDEQGERSYPTLSAKKFVTPGSWASWPNLAWQDYEAETTFYWANA
jgi:hypothetical protein